MAAALLLVVVALPATAQAEDGSGLQPNVVMPVKHGVSQPLRDLPTITIEAMKPGEEVREVNPRNAEIPDRIPECGKAHGPGGPGDAELPLRQQPAGAHGQLRGRQQPQRRLPPDTTGDVGLNHYIQWVNLSFQIFDKTGASVAGPFNGNVLWSGFGGSCQTDNYGDPIVLYDHLADRWLMTQFTGNNHQCIAVSQTADPTGAWYLYDYLADAGSGYFNDYPKLGVWPDGYYFSANMFGVVQAHGRGLRARRRCSTATRLSSSGSSRRMTLATPSWSILPADLDGLTLPPAGAPNPFFAWWLTTRGDMTRRTTWTGCWSEEFHVDWATPGNSTFGVTDVIDLSGPYAFDSRCAAYRWQLHPAARDGQPLETLPTALDVPAAVPQLRRLRRPWWSRTRWTPNGMPTSPACAGTSCATPGCGWGVYQGGTYAPDSRPSLDGRHRDGRLGQHRGRLQRLELDGLPEHPLGRPSRGRSRRHPGAG